MGSVGKRPKYSDERGIILTATVKADDRYETIKSILDEQGEGYYAEDLLRSIMKFEESGDNEGKYYYMQTSSNRNKFGDVVNAYVKALKSAGYKVTKRDNADRKSDAYFSVKGGGYRRQHVTKARILHFVKAGGK